MSRLTEILTEAGGAGAPRERFAQIRAALASALDEGERQLALPRSGTRAAPVEVAFAPDPRGVLALLPLAPALRADPQAAGERAWLLAAATVGALADAASAGPPGGPGDLTLQAGRWREHLALLWPHPSADAAELAALAFEDHAAGIDRLRTGGLALPADLVAEVTDIRDVLGAAHPLGVAEVVARLGGRPADQASVAEHEEAVLAVLAAGLGSSPGSRPHRDPEPSLRMARRIVQRLAGMGKWGGYHTEFTHLARGFAGHERALALETGERLLAAGLLVEKRSVGQRHVFLNQRRAADVYALRDEGRVPPGLELT